MGGDMRGKGRGERMGTWRAGRRAGKKGAGKQRAGGDSRLAWLYALFLVSRFTWSEEQLLGRRSIVKTCLPVHSSVGLMIAGGGRWTASAASAM